ncbi:WD40/YVTN/BNR-like repeat-containing protein [Aquabacterium sp.]|uniref:WD40/YVTN/BNR-like repeat-containing protein n=1 Tax=Aquabacterium sp. TaxID=1872578 RepID=UPI002CD367C2|nr:YCF48-related protein [Aquabacterium sp.]HSW06748.1 YCF48-related protein [Aquabacterium sp.]
MSSWSLRPRAIGLASAGVLALMLTGWAAGTASPAPPLSGTAAVLQAAAAPAVAPQRALLLGLARAGERLVAVGEQGVITLSDDQGKIWRNAAKVPVSATLTAVRFADARVGYAIGHLGVVLRSEDAGEHWTRVLDGQAIAALAMAQAQAGQGKLDEAQRLVDDGPDKPLLDLWVDGPDISIVGAFNLAVHSRDGGRSWRFDSGRFDNPNSMHLYGLARAGGSGWAVGEQGLVLREDLSGKADGHFSALKAPYDGSLFGVLASSDRQVLVHGLRGHAFVTADAGSTWQRANLGPQATGASINGSLRLRDGRIALFDQGGGLFVSADGGLNFQRVPFAWGAPLTGLVEAPDGSLVASSVAGIVTVPRAALQPTVAAASGASR